SLPQNEIAQKIAYLSQTKQIPDISVKRLVLHGRFPYLNYPRRYKEKDYIIVNKVMEKMDILDLADVPISKLSGGQQQKAYLAMALAQDTDVILLDEPTTYLDISFQLQVIKEIKNLANDGKYILMVLHDISLALENSDDIVLIKDGTIVRQGTPKDIYESNILEKVFNVKVGRVEVDNKYHYFCK
ncbi:MAG: ABC transporter ATP-binding protein, partial [Erysipelotrichaceae bacterium]